MSNKEKITETTETVLEKLKNFPIENVDVRLDGKLFQVPVQSIKILAMNSVPDWIRDEHSEEAKKNSLLRTGIKALIRPMLGDLLKKSWGEEISIAPRLNILNFLPTYFINLIINAIATKGWEIHVQRCESGDIFKITGISAYADYSEATKKIPATTNADHQSIP